MLEVEEKQVLELIEKVEKGMKSHDEICKLFDEAIRMIPRWIPVSERLPNIFGEFNVVVKRNTGEIYSDYADFDPFTKRWTTGLFFDIGSKVTHWMPLPEPPKEE
jgi:hypothetical protein